MTIRKRRRDRTRNRIAQKPLKVFVISLRKNEKGVWVFESILTNVFPKSSNTYAEFIDMNRAWEYFLKYLNYSSGWCVDDK
jgi:hypothetical protein